MKEFENKVTTIEDVTENAKDGKATYATLVTHCLNIQPQGGFGMDEIEVRLRIKAVTGSANGKIKLEDADYNKLNELVKGSVWPAIHEDILMFKDDVADAKTVK